MKRLLLLTLALTAFMHADAGNKNKHKKKTKKATTANILTKIPAKSTGMRFCDAPGPQPAWFLELPKGFQFPANFQQPGSYRLVSTIDTVFSSFLSSISYENSGQKIVLPVLIDQTLQCKEFNVSRTMTMDSALQAKYPELMSFKAWTTENSLNAARIDCDGINTRIMITFDKKVYYVTSVIFNKTTYYACYAKDDSNFVKEKFER